MIKASLHHLKFSLLELFVWLSYSHDGVPAILCSPQVLLVSFRFKGKCSFSHNQAAQINKSIVSLLWDGTVSTLVISHSWKNSWPIADFFFFLR